MQFVAFQVSRHQFIRIATGHASSAGKRSGMELLTGMLDACHADVWQTALRWMDNAASVPPQAIIAPIWVMIANPQYSGKTMAAAKLAWREHLVLLRLLGALDSGCHLPSVLMRLIFRIL